MVLEMRVNESSSKNNSVQSSEYLLFMLNEMILFDSRIKLISEQLKKNFLRRDQVSKKQLFTYKHWWWTAEDSTFSNISSCTTEGRSDMRVLFFKREPMISIQRWFVSFLKDLYMTIHFQWNKTKYLDTGITVWLKLELFFIST